MLVPLDGGRATELSSGRMDWQPVCSADGSWALYLSQETGAWQLMRVSTSGGKPALLHEGPGLWWPSISADGRFVGFRAGAGDEDRKFIVIPAEGGAPVHQFDVPPDSEIFSLARDGNGFYYTLRDGDVDNLWYQAMAGGPPRQMTHFTSDHIYAFSFSRDGKRLALTRGNDKRDTVLLSNFR
jgi:Tol biopolymer transport system component